MKYMAKLTMAALCIGMAATFVMATDYSAMSTEEMASGRGTMHQATREEREAFRQEWQSRVQGMSAKERSQYSGRPAGAVQDGSGLQYRQGSGGGSGRGGGRGGRR